MGIDMKMSVLTMCLPTKLDDRVQAKSASCNMQVSICVLMQQQQLHQLCMKVWAAYLEAL